MGLIIGGAIGSALGLSFAPDEGSQTREKIKKSSLVGIKLLRAVYEVIKKRITNHINQKRDL